MVSCHDTNDKWLAITCKHIEAPLLPFTIKHILLLHLMYFINGVSGRLISYIFYELQELNASLESRSYLATEQPTLADRILYYILYNTMVRVLSLQLQKKNTFTICSSYVTLIYVILYM